MKRAVQSVATIAAIACCWIGGEKVCAGEPALFRGVGRCPNCQITTCPDDYDCKPMPAVCFDWRCVPGVYCRKPLPAISCAAECLCADEYYRKPLPDVCPAPCGRWHKCVPPVPAMRQSAGTSSFRSPPTK